MSEGDPEVGSRCGHRAGRVGFPEMVRLEQRPEAGEGHESGGLGHVQRPRGRREAWGCSGAVSKLAWLGWGGKGRRSEVQR